MEYKITSKLINGEVKFGIINDKFEIILPFKYSNVEEKTYKQKNRLENSRKSYYILSNSNNKKGIFLNDEETLIEPIYDYIDYLPMPDDNEYWAEFIVGKQNESKMEYGIIQRQGAYNTYKIVYPFGKADEIKIEDGKVILYKNKGNEVLKGVYKDPQLGTFDPNYTYLIEGISKPQCTPITPNPKDFFVDLSDWSYGLDLWPIEYIMYGKIKNKKEVSGILVKDRKSDGFEIWNELVPCEYNSCWIDTSENLIELSQIKNKRELKGLMGFSTYWNIYNKGACCTYKPEFTIPCEYDQISLLYDASEKFTRNKKKYFLVKQNEKYGLLKIRYSIARGPYDNNYRIRSSHNPAASIEVLLECKYDDISLLSTKKGQSFVFTSDGKKGLLIDGYYDKNHKSLQTNCEYKSIISTSDSNKFVITDFDNKKSVFVPDKVENDCYEFKYTPFNYNSILSKDVLQCSKKIDGTEFYDIYDSSLDMVVADADNVTFEDSVYKASTKVDEKNTRITFINRYGDILLDEQGENISAKYNKELNYFFILKNHIIQIKKPQNQKIDETEFDIQGDYIVFDIVDSGFIKFKKASKNSKMGLYKFVYDSWINRNEFTMLLKDEYESIDIVGNGTRSIVSKIIDDDTPRTKYGVMENNVGNECIPIEYDSIIFDGEYFIASNFKNGEIKQIKFDSDGFYLNSETFESQDHKKVLQLNKTSIN